MQRKILWAAFAVLGILADLFLPFPWAPAELVSQSDDELLDPVTKL
jgi:hypothetical protein